MELVIRGKNLEVSEAVKGHIQRKLGKLERHLPNIDKVEVEVSSEKTRSAGDRFVVQVTIDSRGTLLRGEERATTIDAALDAVVDVLNRQIERFKGKLYSSRRRATSAGRGLAVQQEEVSRVVRQKRFLVRPMTSEEAVEQMELLGHNFFIFVDVESGEFRVLYRRSDGDYGLIEPELA